MTAPLKTDFWKGRKVLVTGHTGFKGSWLSLWLTHLQAQVCGYALPPDTHPNLFSLLSLEKEGFLSVFGNLDDLSHLSHVVKNFSPEIVFHLGAQSLVPLSYQDPVGTYQTNVMGTVHLLEAIRQTPSVKVVVNVTTDKCYLNQEKASGYTEDDPLGGHDPYANSKACSELVTHSYRDSLLSKEMGIATARSGNVIGGGDWSPDRLIPDLIRSFSLGKPALLRFPQAVRPWQHVLDPLYGYLCLAQALWENPRLFSQSWNFGPDLGESISVEEMAHRMACAWGEGACALPASSSALHETCFLKIDSRKARQKLGWASHLPAPQALEWTVGWYKAFTQGHPMDSLTSLQIQDYMRILS